MFSAAKLTGNLRVSETKKKLIICSILLLRGGGIKLYGWSLSPRKDSRAILRSVIMKTPLFGRRFRKIAGKWRNEKSQHLHLTTLSYHQVYSVFDNISM